MKKIEGCASRLVGALICHSRELIFKVGESLKIEGKT